MTTQELAKWEKQELEAEEGTRAGRWYVPDVDIQKDDDGSGWRPICPASTPTKSRWESTITC